MVDYNDANYIELVIKCLFRDKQVLQKALDLRLTPDDVGTIEIYQAFVSTALDIRSGPINAQLCLVKLKQFLKQYGITDNQQTILFWEYIYRDEDLNAEYILANLADFVKFRRFQRLKIEKHDNPEELINEANKLVSDVNTKNTAGGIRAFDPFNELVLIGHRESLSTGFRLVDAATKGLNYQEFGLIIGHSGSGKTAMAIYSAVQNAKRGLKVLYLSLEEPAENICSRAYSNVFRVHYTDLHKGSVLIQDDLRVAFTNMTPTDKQALGNLKIHDLRDVTPISAKFIANYLDTLYSTTGYHPDLVYIDQLDYLTSDRPTDSLWERYGAVAFEVDDLSNHLIGGQHPFTIWLLHQATGKLTRKFSNQEISGFKGIIKPADICLAIGKDAPDDDNVTIFSIKSRHAKNFQFDYKAELEYMNFQELDAGARDRIAQEHKDRESRRKDARSAFSNVPKKSELLPPTGTGFRPN